MTGHQCFSLMSPDSVSILLIHVDVSWCGECPKRDLMNWMWQNMTVMARAQSLFEQALASTETLTCTLLKTEHWWHWGIAMRLSISLWGCMRVLSVQSLFLWTIMPILTVHTSLTHIWNVRQLSVWTGLFHHRTWIRLRMDGTFFSVQFQSDLFPGAQG